MEVEERERRERKQRRRERSSEAATGKRERGDSAELARDAEPVAVRR